MAQDSLVLVQLIIRILLGYKTYPPPGHVPAIPGAQPSSSVPMSMSSDYPAVLRGTSVIGARGLG